MQFPDDIPMLEGWNIAAKCENLKVWSPNRYGLPVLSFNLWWQVNSIIWVCFLGMGECRFWDEYAKTLLIDSIDTSLDSPIPHKNRHRIPRRQPFGMVSAALACARVACAKAPGPRRDPRTPPKRTADTALAGFEGSNLRNSMDFRCLSWLLGISWDILGFCAKNDGSNWI